MFIPSTRYIEKLRVSQKNQSLFATDSPLGVSLSFALLFIKLFRDVDHFSAFVGAAGWTRSVRHDWCAALWASHKLGSSEPMVASAHVALGAGSASLWNCHRVIKVS